MGRFYWLNGAGMPFALREALTTVELAKGGDPYLSCRAMIDAHKIAAMFGCELYFMKVSETLSTVSIKGDINGTWTMDKED